MVTKREKFNALTGYRFFAAIFIVYYHVGFQREFLGDWLYGLQNSMNVGVPLFFTLSGFLIVYRYYNTLELKSYWLRKYFVNRFARIYPVYFGYLFLVSIVHRGWDLKSWLVQLTMTVGLADKPYIKLPQAWSLTVEEMFYFVAPLTIYFFRKSIILRPFFISVLIAISMMVGFKFFPILDSVYNLSDTYVIYQMTIFGRSIEFFLGAFLAYFIIKNKISIEKVDSWKFTLIGLISLFTVMSILASVQVLNNDFVGHKMLKGAIRFTLTPMAACCIILGFIREQNLITNLAGSKVFVLLGESSYVLYLIHLGPLGGIIYGKLGLGVVSGSIAMVVASIFVFLLWEKPMNKLIRKKFSN